MTFPCKVPSGKTGRLCKFLEIMRVRYGILDKLKREKRNVQIDRLISEISIHVLGVPSSLLYICCIGLIIAASSAKGCSLPEPDSQRRLSVASKSEESDAPARCRSLLVQVNGRSTGDEDLLVVRLGHGQGKDQW